MKRTQGPGLTLLGLCHSQIELKRNHTGIRNQNVNLRRRNPKFTKRSDSYVAVQSSLTPAAVPVVANAIYKIYDALLDVRPIDS